ncbi:MAG: serine hydrolase domain-containing protein [Rhodanobacter sp.]
MLRSSVQADAPGASVLIARDDKVIYRSARGKADMNLDVALTPQQVFRIGSITKTFTAATVLKLSAAGKLALSDPLSKFLPDFPNGNHITLAELLDHTSGVSDAWDTDPAKPLDTAALVKLIASHAPDFPPGMAWSYSNSGYMLLGAAIEKVTGQSWDEVVHNQLTEPLGLGHTAFYPDDALVPGMVTGYSLDDHGNVVLPPYVTISGPGAAGALVSTVDDLFHWMRALATGGVLPNGLYQTMSTPKTLANGDPVQYGYGLMLGTVRGEPVVEHNGGIEGFASQLTYFPKQHVTIVVLVNTDAGSPNPRSLAHRLGALAIGKPYVDWRAINVSAPHLQELSGSYRIDGHSTRTLSVDRGVLMMQRDGGPKRTLAVAQNDVLFFQPDGGDYFKIIRDSHGAIVALDFYVDGMSPARREASIH